MQRTISIFIDTAEAFLLAMATVLFLINWTSPIGYVPPLDPVLLLSIRELFWIVGGIALVVALICFLSEHVSMTAFLLLGLALSYLTFRIGLICSGCHNLAGFFGGFSYAFGVSSYAASLMADLLFSYLLIGSCITLSLRHRLPPPTVFEKMACPSCGRYIKFAIGNLGQMIDCPSCKADITLRKHDERLKTSCYFCREHIEFPAHALGRRIKCPHCKMEIGLKEEPK